jgi:hypothetical protein
VITSLMIRITTTRITITSSVLERDQRLAQLWRHSACMPAHLGDVSQSWSSRYRNCMLLPASASARPVDREIEAGRLGPPGTSEEVHDHWPFICHLPLHIAITRYPADYLAEPPAHRTNTPSWSRRSTAYRLLAELGYVFVRCNESGEVGKPIRYRQRRERPAYNLDRITVEGRSVAGDEPVRLWSGGILRLI